VIERKAGERWKPVRKTRTTKAGRYRVKLARTGVYRVRNGSVAGPAVRLS